MEILKREWFYTLPLIVITVFMLSGYSPSFAAIMGLVTCVVISWVRRNTRIDPLLALIVIPIDHHRAFPLRCPDADPCLRLPPLAA